MPMGPGKYDDFCSQVYQETQAKGTLLIVLGGKRGSGFSVTASSDVIADIPELLRSTAKQIEDSFGKA